MNYAAGAVTRVEASPIDRRAAWLGLFVVGAANLRYLAGLSNVIDPVLSMEPYYIAMAGRPLGEIASQDPAWGPLYALWFVPLRALFADPLAIHAANVIVLSVAVTLALYAYTLLLTRRAGPATATALYFLVSDYNVPLSSKVCSFALLLVLASLALSELAASRASRMMIAGTGFVVAGYARPEIFPAGVLLWLVATRAARAEGRRWGVWAACGAGLIAVAVLTVGTPLWSPHHDNHRFFFAFREHFAWNWSAWHGESETFLAVWQREFGAAASMREALVANPVAVLRHVADNAAGAVRLLATESFAHYPILLPPAWPAARSIENFVFSIAAATLLIGAATGSGRRRAVAGYLRGCATPLAGVAASSLAAAVAIYPERHYMVTPLVLALPLFAVIAVAIAPPAPLITRRQALGAAALAIIAVPTPFAMPATFTAPRESAAGRVAVLRPVTDTVHRIRSLDLPPPVRVLTFTDGIGELLGEGFEEVKVWRMGARPMRDYVRDERIDVIVTMERGRKSFLVDDPYWTLVQTDPVTAGFTQVPTDSRLPARIYVRAQANGEHRGHSDER